MTDYVFQGFPKIFRLNREIVITEKLDGTNGLVFIAEDGTVKAGSRSRWITPEQDNYGFAKWVKEHEEELRTGLGPGYHYGEWWGQGIQRKYDLTEKRFSLFNVTRWSETRPACCHVVPSLVRGNFSSELVSNTVEWLRTNGSVASPGFKKPEGVVVFHVPSGHSYKVTLEKDSEPKGK